MAKFKKGDKFRVLKNGPSPSFIGQIETVEKVITLDDGTVMIIPDWRFMGIGWAYGENSCELIEEEKETVYPDISW